MQMTKSLTEQWKDGKLQENTYYVQFICGRYGIYEFEQFKGFGFDNDCAYIKEVLAPVPSYDEYKRLQQRNKKLEKMAFHYTPEEWNTMMRKIERLQEQLHEANMVILSLPAEKISTCIIACEYLDKWGVK